MCNTKTVIQTLRRELYNERGTGDEDLAAVI